MRNDTTMLRVLARPKASKLLGILSSRVLSLKLENTWSRPLSSTSPLCHERLYEVLPPLESFSRRHIGVSPEDIKEMLDVCGVKVREFKLARLFVIFSSLTVIAMM